VTGRPTAPTLKSSFRASGPQGLRAVGVGRGNDDAWRAAQDKLATLSTHIRNRIVADATRASLVDQTDAPAVSQAIRDVAAVESDQPLASR
jgi:hypothetical protein